MRRTIQFLFAFLALALSACIVPDGADPPDNVLKRITEVKNVICGDSKVASMARLAFRDVAAAKGIDTSAFCKPSPVRATVCADDPAAKLFRRLAERRGVAINAFCATGPPV